VEKENVENQLGFLRNQVSPHFFMNTLNNIHSLIDINSEEAKESIIKLSKLMRHLLYESEAEQIPISKELEFVRNYVDLMRLRYSKKVSIDLEITGQVADKYIPPLLFTSFLENAFKHGIGHNDNSYIRIAFNFVEERLEFCIINSNPHAQKENGHSGGIGIENSRKRLDLLYADRYSLEIDDGNDAYTVTLILPV
jgi:LytS/YehU family sensor histidine kinase